MIPFLAWTTWVVLFLYVTYAAVTGVNNTLTPNGVTQFRIDWHWLVLTFVCWSTYTTVSLIILLSCLKSYRDSL